MDYSQFLGMWQEISLLILILAVFLADTFSGRNGCKGLGWLAVAGMAVVTGLGFTNLLNPGNEVLFGGMYQQSAVTWGMKNILNIGTVIVLLQSLRWASAEFVVIRRGEFYELLLITLLGMYFMISSGNFLMFVIGLETASLPLAALVAFNKHRYESHEAAVKYVLTAVFSSAVFLFGLSYVYGLAGTLYYSEIGLQLLTLENPVMLIVALAFVIAGFGFKLSLVPFHLWTADVYQGAPTPVTSYLSVISKGSAALALLIVLWQVFGVAYSVAWEWMMYGLIIATITVGNLFALRQDNLKRFLAFSSISQAGYIMLGVIGFNELSLTALMFYVLVYIFSNLGAFGVIGAVENATGHVTITSYNGLYKTNPRLAFTMMLAMFSLAGIPPFAGFFSKFFIFTGALAQGSVAMYVLVGIALINTIVSLYYYLLVVRAMFISAEEPQVAPFRSAGSERLGMIICTLGIIFIGMASWVYTYIMNLVGETIPY